MVILIDSSTTVLLSKMENTAVLKGSFADFQPYQLISNDGAGGGRATEFTAAPLRHRTSATSATSAGVFHTA